MLEDPVIIDALNQVLRVLILALASIVTFYVGKGARAFIAKAESEVGATNLGYAKDITTAVVRALAQSAAYRDFDGAAKKERAIIAVDRYLNEYGIDIDEDLVDDLIEESVQIMKAELAEVIAEVPEPPGPGPDEIPG